MRGAIRACAARIASKFGASVCKDVAFIWLALKVSQESITTKLRIACCRESLCSTPRDREGYFRGSAIVEAIGDLHCHGVFARSKPVHGNLVAFLRRIGKQALRKNDHPIARVDAISRSRDRARSASRFESYFRCGCARSRGAQILDSRRRILDFKAIA